MAIKESTPIGKIYESITSSCSYYLSNGRTTPTYILLGPPGIGKTAIGKQVAKALKTSSYIVDCTSIDPTDVRGLLRLVGDGDSEFTSSPIIPRNVKNGVLVLDEFTSAIPAVQTAFHQLLLDRKAGKTEIPKDFVIIATGNRRSDTNISSGLQPPAMDRMAIIPVKEDVKSWKEWALENKIHPYVIAYIDFKPQDIMTFTGKDVIRNTEDTKPFITPRSWELFSNELYACNIPMAIDTEIDQELINEMSLRGSWYAPHSVTSSFTAFVRVASKVPKIEDVVEDKVDVSKLQPEIKMTLVTSAIYHYDRELLESYNKPTQRKKVMNSLAKFTTKIPTEFSHKIITHFIKKNKNNEEKQYFDREDLVQYKDFEKTISTLKKVISGK